MDAVVAEAAKLGYPVNEMAIGGGSAGGCLALLYAYRDTAESPVPVRFVFEAVGPSSFYPEDWDNYGLDKPEAQAEAAGLFGVMTGAKLTPDMFGTPAYDAAVKDASALLWVTKDAVPTVMAYCTHDTMQPSRHRYASIGRLPKTASPTTALWRSTRVTGSRTTAQSIGNISKRCWST